MTHFEYTFSTWGNAYAIFGGSFDGIDDLKNQVKEYMDKHKTDSCMLYSDQMGAYDLLFNKGMDIHKCNIERRHLLMP